MRRTRVLWEAYVTRFEDALDRYKQGRLTAEEAGERGQARSARSRHHRGGARAGRHERNRISRCRGAARGTAAPALRPGAVSDRAGRPAACGCNDRRSGAGAMDAVGAMDLHVQHDAPADDHRAAGLRTGGLPNSVQLAAAQYRDEPVTARRPRDRAGGALSGSARHVTLRSAWRPKPARGGGQLWRAPCHAAMRTGSERIAWRKFEYA
jgi:hypothetical protein